MAALVIDYLKALPEGSIEQLYDNIWTCQAIYRSLPPLSKLYVSRLLFVGQQETRERNLRKWVNWSDPEARSAHQEALERLRSLSIFIQQQKPMEGPTRRTTRAFLTLNPLFQQQLILSMANIRACPWGDSDLPPDKEPPSLQKLQDFSRRQWESVLLLMFGTNTKAHDEVMHLYQQTGLLEASGQITPKGYRYLLQDPFSQIWSLLLAHLDQNPADRAELLVFLFQLSFLTVGQDYPVQALTEPQSAFVKLLAEFGLIYKSTRGSRRFYPTALAVNLISGKVTMKQEGFVVAETNLKVYAYCQSLLSIRILSLFVELTVRLPNLVMGKVTQASIHGAMARGINAEQMVRYLEQNAHPETQKMEFPIPETFIHQIYLWEGEEVAITPQEGTLYSHFPSPELYQQARDYASSLGILLWSNDENNVFFVAHQPAESKRHLENFILQIG